MYNYLLLFAVTALTINLTPGPAMMYCINTSIKYGKSSGIAAAIGVELGTFIYVLITGLGLSTLILASSIMYSGLKALGSLYLIYLAYKALPNQNVIKTEGGFKSKTSTLLAGLILNVTNPKILLFFITLLPQFVPVEHRNIKIFFFLGLAFNFSGLIVNLLAVFFSHRLRDSLAHSTKITKVIRYIPSAVFFLIAIFSLALIAHN